MCSIPPVKKVRKAKKPVERSVNIFRTTEGGWLMRIVEGPETDFYEVECDLATFDGLLLKVTKTLSTRDGERGEEIKYIVAFNPADGYRACTCKGFVRHGHCRHYEGLIALHGRGRLHQMIEETAAR